MGNLCVFSYFSCAMQIHFSHILEIVCISASRKIFEKPITLECLCFPIFFPYYGNSLFPCFGNWLDFCFKRKISETLNFEMLVCFPYFFLTLWIHFPHIFGIICINATHEICKKPIALECLCFPIRFPYYENSVISMFSELNGFLFHAKQSSAEYIRNRNLWNICVFP